jgi:hypothetical protein
LKKRPACVWVQLIREEVMGWRWGIRRNALGS